MSSKRLPGKVLMTAAGKPLLETEIERLQKCRTLDRIIIATTVNAGDDPIAALAQKLGVGCFRGSENDVLGRFAGAARQSDADVIARICGDCPLIDPAIVDATVGFFLEHAKDADYVSNVLVRRLPRGMDTEVLWSRVLLEADPLTQDPYDREHVTPFIYRHPERYRLKAFVWPEDLSRHRWTVDVPEDLDLMRKILGQLYPSKPDFSMADVLALLKSRPDWAAINQHVQQQASA